MFKAIVLAAFLAFAVAAPAPASVVSTYASGVVNAPAVAYSVPAVSTYAASPVVASYGVQPVAYGSYGSYGSYAPYGYGYAGVPVTYY